MDTFQTPAFHASLTAALFLCACTETPPVAAPAERDRAALALSRFEAVIAGGGDLYELSNGRCARWTISPPTDASKQDMSHVVGDGRTLIYQISYDPGLRSLQLWGPGTEYEHPPPPSRNGWTFIGSGSYCTQSVQIAGAADGDAILVDDSRRWYLSREPCLRAADRAARGSALARNPMCHDAKAGTVSTSQL